MGNSEKEEIANLQIEFEWLLREEVHAVLTQLHSIVLECARRFPVPLCDNDGPLKQDKFVLVNSHEQLKCVVTLTGDIITHADINLKVQRPKNVVYRTAVHHEHPWKLHQIQDAGNYLQQALCHIDNVDRAYMFKSSEEVLHVFSCIYGSLQRGRTALVVPRKKAIDELLRSRNMKYLNPPLPEDLAVSFYIQSHKLVFAAYRVSNSHGNLKYEAHQADCSVPWLNEVLILFTVALQLCRQLKDKIYVFTQYKDFTDGSRSCFPLGEQL